MDGCVEWSDEFIDLKVINIIQSIMELVKVLDKWGRLVVPKEWREKYARNRLVLLRVEGDRIIIEPYRLPDLTKYFDSVEVDLKSDLTYWKAVKRELFNTR